MATYLPTWNPRKWDWNDLQEHLDSLAQGKVVQTRWSCGARKRIEVGARVFLHRQGHSFRE